MGIMCVQARPSVPFQRVANGWALWVDSVSLPINTTMSHDQFKPIRIRKKISGKL